MYNNHPLYISGESYAGVYVPLVAIQIIWYNQNNAKSPFNLKGIAVGDDLVTWGWNSSDSTLTSYRFNENHAIIPVGTTEKYRKYCIDYPSYYE